MNRDRPADLIWIQETPLRNGSKSQTGPYTRRQHRKSRRGCDTCKRRRVKCDEKRPVCSICSFRNIECIYSEPQSSHKLSKTEYHAPASDACSSPPSSGELSSEAALGSHVFATSIARLADRSAASGKSSTSLVHILRHFERSSYRTLSSPTGQRVLHDRVPPLLMSYPFLLHTVLAFSSSHLRYLNHNVDPNAMALTAFYHTQRALNLYSERINTHRTDTSHSYLSSSTGLEEMDALFAACIMLTSLFYHVNEIDLPYISWTVSPLHAANQVQNFTGGTTCSSAGTDWLTNISGLSILLQLAQFQQQITQSAWFPFLIESSPRHSHVPPWQYPTDDRAENLQRRLELACTVSDPASMVPRLLELILASPSPEYSSTLSILTPLLMLDPADLRNFSSFISFPSKLSQKFVGNLRLNPPDPVALLIVGYWFWRMSIVPHWWCRARGQGEVVSVAWYVETYVRNSMETGMGEGGVNANRIDLLRGALEEFKRKTKMEISSDWEVRGKMMEERMWTHLRMAGSERSWNADVLQCPMYATMEGFREKMK